jgi:hypothetical protein
VQSNPISATDSILFFAVNTYGRFSNAALGEYDIYIDANGDGVPDFILFSADIGLIETGFNNGKTGTFLFNLATGALFFFFYRKLIACRIRPSLDGGFTNSAERCDLAASRSSAPRP